MPCLRLCRSGARADERALLQRAAYVQSVSIALAPTVPVIAAIITFLCHVGAGYNLTAAQVRSPGSPAGQVTGATHRSGHRVTVAARLGRPGSPVPSSRLGQVIKVICEGRDGRGRASEHLDAPAK